MLSADLRDRSHQLKLIPTCKQIETTESHIKFQERQFPQQSVRGQSHLSSLRTLITLANVGQEIFSDSRSKQFNEKCMPFKRKSIEGGVTGKNSKLLPYI